MYLPHTTPQKLRHKIQLLIMVILVSALSNIVLAGEKRSSSPAQYPGIEYDGSKLKRKDFNFFGFKAWLKQGGEWSIEGTVAHNGLLCGTYEVGIRFGVAKNGCTDVEWITTDRYITSQMQCNNATMVHKGLDIDPELASRFNEITCAERVVRCTGTCK